MAASTSEIEEVATKLSSISLHNVSSSPLLQLPAEIRLYIYACVIASGSGPREYRIEAQSQDKNDGPAFTIERTGVDYLQHIGPKYILRYGGLLLSCRQIHHEAKLLPFQLVTLAASALRFARLRFTPEQKNAIRSIRLVFSLDDPTRTDLPSLWPHPFQEQPRPLHDAMVRMEGLRRISFIVRYRAWLWPHFGREEILTSELLSSYEVLKKWVNRWVLQGCGTDYLECEGNTTHDGGPRVTWIVRPALLRENK